MVEEISPSVAAGMAQDDPVSAMNRTGFSLVELLMTFSIVGVLLVLAVPNLRSMMLTQEVKSAAVDLHTGLLYARSEAIKRNATVELVPAGGWNAGWKVAFGTTTLRAMQPHPSLTISGPTGNVAYGRDGRLLGSDVDFEVRVTGNTDVIMRCISVSPSGLAHVEVDGDGNPANGCGS